MGPPPVPRSPEDVFRDFRARRAGLIRALTTGNPRLAFAFASPTSPPPTPSGAPSSHCFPLSLCRCGEVLRDVRPR